MSEPAKVADDLAAIVEAARPNFRPCTACGALTSGRVCFDCMRRRDLVAKARDALESTIPDAFRWARFDAPELGERVQDAALIGRAREAVGCRRVVLAGTSGRGKTSLVICMARAWVAAQAEPAVFFLATQLATARERSPYGRGSAEIEAAIAAPLLVLDDVGTDTPSASSALIEVVFSRHQRLRPTWLTTWLRVEDAQARYGDGFARRVFEGARVLEWPKESR